MRKCQVCGRGRGMSTEFEGVEAEEGPVTPVTVSICRQCALFLDELEAGGTDGLSLKCAVWEQSFHHTLFALGLT